MLFFAQNHVIPKCAYSYFLSFFFLFHNCSLYSNTVLNKGSERWYLYPAPDLRRSPLSFSPFCIKVALGLSYTVIIWMQDPSKFAVNYFSSQRGVEPYQMLFQHYWDDHMVWVPHSTDVTDDIYWFVHVEPSLYSCIECSLNITSDPCWI